MNAPERGPAAALTPEAAALVETYFARVHGALLVAAAGECQDAVDELRDHVLEELATGDGTPADVTRVLAELGTPEAVAAEYAAERDDGDAPPQPEPGAGRLHGRFLGMPYDVRVPDSSRIASRWWNPLDPRVFVPRVFGLGWDVNFGALAVKVHLVRPDDEDEPFATVPAAIVTATIAVPALLATALLALIALAWPSLPPSVPAHWNAVGTADQFWDRSLLAVFLATMSLLPTVLAGSVHVRRRSALNRVAASAAATLMASLALTQFVQALLYVRGDQGMAPTFAGLALALAAPFLMLVVLSRIGRAAEQRRDFENRRKKGSS
jgi:hypothetical protein